MGRKKKKSASSFKISYLILGLVMIPVLYGLYLYSQQTGGCQPHQAVTYTQLEIPIEKTARQGQVIAHTGYTVSYNKTLKIPNWVAYELTRQETEGKEKRSNRFVTDPMVKGATATNGDYARSGYDKGHMAPAADMKWNDAVMKESFYFSNMCPQHPLLNRRKWKDLEEKIRNWAVADSAIIVVCGPIVDNDSPTIGKNRISVPKAFFKVILSPYAFPPKAIGFLFENKSSEKPLRTYAITIDSIESITQLDFFAPLPDKLEETLESKIDATQWGI